MTRDEIKQLVAELASARVETTEADVALALVEIDQDALVEGFSAQAEIWNRTMPINGVMADAVKAMPGYSDDGAVGIVRDGDRVLVLQLRSREDNKVMTVDNAKAEMQSIVDEMRESRRHTALLEALKAKVVKGPTER